MRLASHGRAAYGQTARRALHPRLHLRETGAKPGVPTVAPVDVVLLRWPLEHDRRNELHRAGQPLLLLVEDGTDPPVAASELEDWIRVPARRATCRRGSRVCGLEPSRGAAAPELDLDGVLRLDGSWVALPPVEARLTGALLDRFGAVVSRDALAKAGWPDGAPGRNALDVHMLRLRRRVAPLALVIRTVRSRGYLLERLPDPGRRRRPDVQVVSAESRPRRPMAMRTAPSSKPLSDGRGPFRRIR